MPNKTMKSRFATLSHWLQSKKAQQIAPALLTAYGSVIKLGGFNETFNIGTNVDHVPDMLRG